MSRLPSITLSCEVPISAFARQAEPCRGPVTAELGTAEFQNFQSGLDCLSNIPGRAARWTDVAWRAFRAANEAKPQATRGEDRRDLCGKTNALLLFVEDMEAAAVEDKLKGSLGRRGHEKVR